MRSVRKVNARVYDQFVDRAERIGKTAEFERWLRSRTPQKVDMFHVAGVEEEDPRWLAMKEDLIATLPTGMRGWPRDWTGLYTQMGEKPDFHIVPHGGERTMPDGSPVEKPLSPEDKKLIDDTARELYAEYVFSGVRLTKSAALGPYELERSPGARMATLLRHPGTLKAGFLHKYADWSERRGEAHLRILLEHDYSLMAAPVARRQQNKPKERPEWVSDKLGLTMIPPWSVRLPKPWMTCRYRTPQMMAGAINLPMAVHISGMVQPSEKRFAFMLKHRSAWDVAAKMEAWFAKAKDRHPGRKPWVLMFDVAGMEKFTPTYASEVALRRLDELLGPEVGIYRVVHNNPIIAPMGKKSDFLISVADFNYKDSDCLGYGTRSGMATVVAANQIAVLAALRRILHHVTGKMYSIAELNGEGDSDLALLSKTDDNVICGVNEVLLGKLAGKTFNALGLEITFEVHPNYPQGQAAEFLAVTYALEGGKVKPYKSMRGGVGNIICSESGLQFDEARKSWFRNSPKGEGKLPAGLGFVMRMQEYLLHEDDAEMLWDHLCGAFSKHLKMRWWEAFPVSSTELITLGQSLEADDPINALEYILRERPDYIHRAQIDPDDLPEELQRRFYLRVGVSDYRKIFGDNIPMEEHVQSPPRLTDHMPNVERFIPFLAKRVKELQAAGL